MMTDDMALVKEYAMRDSEQAFAALVSRHVGLVHSVAMRQAAGCFGGARLRANRNIK